MIISSRTLLLLLAAGCFAGAMPLPAAMAQQPVVQQAGQSEAKAHYAAAYAILSSAELSAEALGQAADLLRQAASAGYAPAQHLLGVMYLAGNGVARDPARAWQLFEAAAQAGENDARNALGQMLYKGDGVPRDDAAAAEWFSRAVAGGSQAAMVNLGYLYMNGLGVAKDTRKGLELTQSAAEAGLAEAQHNLAWMYEKGVGVNQDTHEALRWYLRAADSGYAPAQLNAGFIYATGEAGGDMRDQLTQAVKWFALASTARDAALQQTARGAIRHVAERVPAEVVNDGLVAAKKWTWTH